MSASGIIDADGHVVEPDFVFEERLPARFRGFAPRIVREAREPRDARDVRDSNADRGAAVERFHFESGDVRSFSMRARPESLSAPRQPGERSGAGSARSGAHDPAGRLVDMDLDRIEQAVIFPTFGLMVQQVTEPEAAVALCRAINDWLADYCRHAPERLFAVGVLPQTSAEAALAEAVRCVETLGFRGVWRRPERIPGTPALHSPEYDRLWSYLAEVDRPLALHPGLNGLVPCAELRHRFADDYSAMHAVHFPMEQMMGLTELVVFGVLDRHPSLRVALLESGAVWALAQLHRLDEHLELFGFPNRPKEKPSDQFRRQGFVSVEEVEPGLAAMLESYPESVVFASDYPHGDGVFPGSTTPLLETDALSERARDALLFGNARRLYAL